jgi:glycosyltransferase involved in cell wall biosynthesis
VVFVSSGLDLGGAETMLYRLATHLDATRFRVGAVSLSERGEIGARLEAAGIPVVALNLQRGRIPWDGMRKLLDVLRDLDPDVLQGWMYHGNLAASLAGWLSGRSSRVLWGVRQCLYQTHHERALTRRVIRTCAALSWQPAAVIYNSDASREQHEAFGFAARKSVVVPNGFELQPWPTGKEERRRRLGLPAHGVLIGMITRYHPCKGHAVFLAAAAALAARRPDVTFVLAGRQVDSGNARLMQLARDLGIEGRVVLLGQQPDVGPLLESLDVLCMPSTGADSFPNVVGEAMAAGVPCVVSRVGDAARIVRDTGVSVAPGYSEALAQALEAMIDLGSTGRGGLGAAARLRVAKHYGLASVVERYESIYEEVANHVRNRRALQAEG